MEESKKVTEGKELKVLLQPLALFSLAPHLLLSLSCTAARLASVHNWSSWQIKELEQLLATEQQSFHDKDSAATQQIPQTASPSLKLPPHQSNCLPEPSNCLPNRLNCLPEPSNCLPISQTASPNPKTASPTAKLPPRALKLPPDQSNCLPEP